MTDLSRRSRLRARALAHAPGARRGTAASLDEARPLAEDARVLVVRPDHLGDVLFVGPAVALLRRSLPRAHLTLLVGPWSEEVARRLPGVDEVLPVAFPWFDRQPRGYPWRPYWRLWTTARRLRHGPPGPFDVALILRDDDYWGAWLTALAGIPERFGHDEPGVRAFATAVLDANRRPTHTSAANVALVAAATATVEPDQHDGVRLQLTDEDRRLAVDVLSDGLARALVDRPGGRAYASALAGEGAWRPIAVHPGSGSPVKRWRSQAWAEAVDALAERDEPVVVTGATEERGLADALVAATSRPVVDLVGMTSVGSLAGVYERCRLVMGPDSGPLHLATAVGTPTVHLFGPADPQRYGPRGEQGRHRVVRSELPCAPCARLDWADPHEHPCVRVIEVARVVGAAHAALRASERQVATSESPSL